MGQTHPPIHIIGQGLAGTLLAFECQRRKRPFTIFDSGLSHASSMVAAGMWNPISIKRNQAGWRSVELLRHLFEVYPRIEQQLSERFFHPLPIHRIFPDVHAGNEWDQRSVTPEMNAYMHEPNCGSIKGFPTPFGFGEIQGGGWLNLPSMLQSARLFFQQLGVLREELVNQHQIRSWVEDEITVIHSTGSRAIEKSEFARIPILPNKGDVLTLNSTEFGEQSIVHFGKFLLPLGDGKFRLGSTYHPNSSNSEVTEQSRLELIDALKAHTTKPFEVLTHDVGIRPTTVDRRPLAGRIPGALREFVLGGLGSKGVLLAPALSCYVLDLMEGKCAVDLEVDPARLL
jgi:glycine oxidase